jgi:hypothetical protein
MITAAIAPQNFELIRDRIGAILLSEFANQYTNFGLPVECFPKSVDVERFDQIDEETLPAMVVRFVSGDYMDDDGTPAKFYDGDSNGKYLFEIGVIVGSASTDTVWGDQQAAFNLQRILGLVRSILSNPQYDTLGFDLDTMNVLRVYCKNLKINDPKENDNTNNVIYGTLDFVVVCSESTPLVDPGPIASFDSVVKVYDQDNFRKWRYSLYELAITVPQDDTTLTDSFFSNPILSIVYGPNTYLLGTDFTQSGATITAITFAFYKDDIIIARTQ